MNFTFDWNEWFLIITSSISFSFFLPIRKYFPPVMIITIWVYNIAFVSTIDYFLVGSPFNLYYFSDNNTYEASAALFHLFMYPCASLLFLYGYDKWDLRGKKTFWYILSWSGFAIFFEWVCVKNHVLTYTGWKMYYSIPVYPVTAFLLIIFFRFTKKQLKNLLLQKQIKTHS